MSKRNNKSQLIINIFFMLVALACILPFILLFMSSITDETEILKHGYSFFPQKISMFAYEYLLTNINSILRAYGITILITVVGTAVGLLMMAMLAYPLSRTEFKHRNVITFYVVFTMLLNGGLVPTYILYTRYLHFKNTLWALLIPYLLMRGFYVIIMRTFFKTTIPDSIIESVRIDGGGEWRIFFQIVLPLSYPVLATVGLFLGLGYWNDWMNGLIFISETKLYSIQVLLNRILLDIQYLSNNQLSGTYDTGVAVPQESIRMALAVIGIVPIFIAYPFFQRFFVKGLTIGAVKG